MSARDAAVRTAGRALLAMPARLRARALPRRLGYDPAAAAPVTAFPAAPVRLLIAPVNAAGQGWQWSRAVERQLDGVAARSMSYELPSGFGFPVDTRVAAATYVWSAEWQRRQRAAVLAGATHVIVESEQRLFGGMFSPSLEREVALLRRRGIAVATMSHGSDIRTPSHHAGRERDSPFRDTSAPLTRRLAEETLRNHAVLERMRLPAFISTPDLLLDLPGAIWVPVVVDAARWAAAAPALQREGAPVVVHAPSRAGLKGSDRVEPILGRLHDEGVIHYRRLDSVPAAEMPAAYGEADIVVDQFSLGIAGVAAAEAMASGRLVVSHVGDQVRDHIARTTGRGLPVLQARAEELDAVLRAVAADPTPARALAAEGPRFVADVHDGRRSALALAQFLGSGPARGDERLD